MNGLVLLYALFFMLFLEMNAISLHKESERVAQNCAFGQHGMFICLTFQSYEIQHKNHKNA